MKKSEIRVGGHYVAKVSNRLVTVRVDKIEEDGRSNWVMGKTKQATRYHVTNLSTGRKTVFRSAAKFRYEAKGVSKVLPPTQEVTQPTRELSQIEELQRQIAELEASEKDDSCPFVAPTDDTTAASATTISSVSQRTAPPTEEPKRPFVSAVSAKLAAQLSPASTSAPSAALHNNVPHIEVQALAGTGKTTTVVQGLIEAKGGTPAIAPSDQQRAVWDALKLGKLDSVRVSAFNKSITEEMGGKINGAGLNRKGVECRGVHSLGLQAVTATFGRVRASQWAVLDMVAAELGGNFRDLLKVKGMPATMKATDELVSLCKQTLSPPTPEELDKLTSRFDVDMGDNQQRVYDLVPTILERCKTPHGNITFDDMVWLPVVLDLPIYRADCQIIDEAQDLNRMQQELIYRGGHRIVFVGDRNQAIYGFAGADSESMQRMYSHLSGNSLCNCGADRTGPSAEAHDYDCPARCGCQTLPLTVTRRCGRAIVEEAREYVPEYEAHESNPDGKVDHAKYPIQQTSGQLTGGVREKYELPWEETYCPLVRDGALAVCRVNAPLIKECFRFLKRGIKANILGKKIGEGLISLVEKSKAHTVSDLVGWLDDWLAEEQERESKKRYPSESKLEMVQDKYDCLVTFTEGLHYHDEVKTKINSVFTDERNGRGVRFSSIHKSKGLEAQQVFIIQPPSASPRRERMQQWELQQEANLRYVAITRAIKELIYVS